MAALIRYQAVVHGRAKPVLPLDRFVETRVPLMNSRRAMLFCVLICIGKVQLLLIMLVKACHYSLVDQFQNELD